MMAKIEWYEEILALEPGSKVFFPFAKRLAEDGLHDKALAVLRHGLVQHPEYLEARVFLTHLLFAVGDTQTAMTEAQQVFARLAPYPAFWEALSLAHEAVPGDMNLAMRFLAEGLRAPGLTLAAAMRRGLAPQAGELQQGELQQPPVPAAPVAEDFSEAIPEVIPEAEPVAPEAVEDAVAAVAELPQASPETESLPEPAVAEPSFEPEYEQSAEPILEGTDEPEDAADPEVDPLAPVADEIDLPLADPAPLSAESASSFAESGLQHDTGESLLQLDDAPLPLFDAEPVTPVAEEEIAEAPEPVMENAAAVLADAASLDEALAALEDGDSATDGADSADAGESLTSDGHDAESEDAEGEEPPLMTQEALEELRRQLLAEEDEGADSGEVIPEEAPADSETPAEGEAPVEAASETPEPAFEMEAPLAAAAADEPLAPVDLEDLDRLLETSASPVDSGETADEPTAEEALEEIPQETPQEIPEKPQPLLLDDGLLGFDEEPSAPEAQESSAALAPAEAQAAPTEAELPETANQEATAEPAAEPMSEPAAETSDDDLPDDEPVRTRSMADVLAEQGDIDGALTIYEELCKVAAPDEAASLRARMDTLRGLKTAEKPEPKTAPRSDKAGLRSMLENLAGRLEKRAKADSKH